MCKYCDNITTDSVDIYCLDTSSDGKRFFLGTGDSYYDTEIEYCPFCGRKLEEK